MSVSLNNLSTAISTLQSDIATINNNNTSVQLVYCCGYNTKYELGLGEIYPNNIIHVNYAFPTINNITQVSTGTGHSLFLDSTGKVYSCGYNYYGKTGQNTYLATNTLVPTEIAFGDIVGRTIIQVSAGANHSLFLDSTGKVYSCGYDRYGVTGQNTDLANSTIVPTEIFGDIVGRTITQVSAGTLHSLLLDSEGRVYAFGTNASGKTGLNGGSGNTISPTEIAFGDIVGKPIIQVSAGTTHSLFLDSTGKVYSTGNTFPGQYTAVPTEIALGDIVGRNIIQVSAGNNYSLFLDSTGRAYSCGYTSLTISQVPSEIVTGDIVGRTIIQVAAGYDHQLFLDSTGRAYSCGNNIVGKTGLNTTSGYTTVPTIIRYFVFINKTIAHIITGSGNSFFIAN